MNLRHWHFTIFLLVSYIATFHLWRWLTGRWILMTGVIISAVLCGVLFAVGRRGYFINLWDRLFHGAVILDILVEGFFDQHSGFYLCALGFAVAIFGYRLAKIAAAKMVADAGSAV